MALDQDVKAAILNTAIGLACLALGLYIGRLTRLPVNPDSNKVNPSKLEFYVTQDKKHNTYMKDKSKGPDKEGIIYEVTYSKNSDLIQLNPVNLNRYPSHYIPMGKVEN